MLQVRVGHRVSASTVSEFVTAEVCRAVQACSWLESLVLVPLPLNLHSQLCYQCGPFRKLGNQDRIHRSHLQRQKGRKKGWRNAQSKQWSWPWQPEMPGTLTEGRNLWRLSGVQNQTALLWQNHLQQVARTMSNQVLCVSKDADFMTSLGNLFHYKSSR